MRRRRVMSPSRLSQVAVSSGDSGDSVRVSTRSTACSILRAAAIAHGKLRRRLRRPQGQFLSTTPAGLRPAGLWHHARLGVQQFHQRGAGAVHFSPIRPPRKARRSAPRRRWRSSSIARPLTSSRCAARPTRASPATCSRPTMPYSRSPTSISNCSRAPPSDSATAPLEDQRDQYINQLSKLIDIRVATAATIKSRCSPPPAPNWSAPRLRSSISTPPARLQRRSNGTPTRPKAASERSR